jgi:Ca2+-binding RTX toxin-like protein
MANGKIFVGSSNIDYFNISFFPSNFNHTFLFYDADGDTTTTGDQSVIQGLPSSANPGTNQLLITTSWPGSEDTLDLDTDNDGIADRPASDLNLVDITSYIIPGDAAAGWAQLLSQVDSLGSYVQPGQINTNLDYFIFGNNCNAIVNTLLTMNGTTLIAHIPVGTGDKVYLTDIPSYNTIIDSATSTLSVSLLEDTGKYKFLDTGNDTDYFTVTSGTWLDVIRDEGQGGLLNITIEDVNPANLFYIRQSDDLIIVENTNFSTPTVVIRNYFDDANHNGIYDGAELGGTITIENGSNAPIVKNLSNISDFPLSNTLQAPASWYMGFSNEFMSLGVLVRDPLMIDLDGDGVAVDIVTGSSVYFDIDNDGLGEAVSWVNGDDGILVRDLNGNGKIDDNSEMFGNATTNGYEALRALDSNNDGQITSADTGFNTLKIWKDGNADAQTDDGELSGLGTYNIASIKLNDYTINGSGNGNITHTGTAILTNGTSVQTANYGVLVNQGNSEYLKEYDLDIRTLFLPTLRGYGNMTDLHIGMSMDNGDASTSLFSQVTTLVSRESTDIIMNWKDVKSDFIDILYNWAGVENVVSTSRGPYVDAKKLAFLEAYTGSNFINGAASSLPSNQPESAQAREIDSQFNELVDRLLGNFMIQTSMSEVMTGDLSYDPVNDNISGWTTTTHALSTEYLDTLTQYAISLPDTASRLQFWTGYAGLLRGIDISAGTEGGLNYAITAAEENILDAAIQLSDASLSWHKESHDPLSGIISIEYRYENPSGDMIVGTSANDTLNGTINEDLISGLGGTDILSGGDLADRIFGHSENGVGDDGASDTLNGQEGNDYLDGGDGNDFLYGGNGNDHLLGGNGNDYLDGGGTPQSQRSQNILEGGLGNDYYKLNISGNGVGTTEDFITDIGGTDTIEFSVGTGGGDLSFTRIGNAGLQISTGTIASHTVTIIDQLTNPALGNGIEFIKFNQNNSTLDLRAYLSTYTGTINTIGSDTNDIIYGITVGNINDTIYGKAGNDFISGDDGNDYIEGGDGNDEIYGGNGNDTLSGQNGFDRIYGGDGSDTIAIWGGAAYGGNGNDNISVGTSTGAVAYGEDGDDTIILNTAIGSIGYGGNGNDTIIGNSGDDFLYGGAGNDTLNGGASGNDTVGYIDALNGVTVNLSLGYANVLNMGYDTFTSIENVSGSNFDDNLTGTSGRNTLWGAGGNDILDGGGNIDTLYGGIGNDILLGGASKDTLFGDDGNDQLNGGTDNDDLYGGAGNDTILYSAASTGFIIYRDNSDYLTIVNTGNTTSTGFGTDRIYNDVETITFSDITLNLKDGSLDAIGSEWGYNTVNGTSAADTLSGSVGRDIIYGNDGNDTIYGNDRNDRLFGGNGADTVYGELGNDVIEGNAGNDNLYGGSGNDELYGQAGNDTLRGEAGDDILDGGTDTGSDWLIGGDGMDTVSYQTATSAVIVNLSNLTYQNTFGAGSDRLAGIENITGSTFNDILEGDYLANTISGGLGNDVLQGGGGIDILDGGDGIDTVSYAGGIDSVNVDLRYNLTSDDGTGVSDTLSSIENVTGSSYGDTIIGNDGANTLDGGSGNDTIEGGKGNDVINGGAGVDTISYASATSRVNFNLSLTTAQFTQDAGTDTVTGFENILGSSYSDDLVGDANDNVIDGGAGSGYDNMNGGTGIDTISYASASVGVSVNLTVTIQQNTIGAGKDIIVGFENILGSSYFDNLTGDGNNNSINGASGNDNIIGGAGNDTLIGGLGDDSVNGGEGNDVYYYTSGRDTLTETGTGVDKVVFDSIWSPYNVIILGNSQILLHDQNKIMFNDINLVETFSFSGFADMTLSELATFQTAKVLEGTNGNDNFEATLFIEAFNGGEGNDTVDFKASVIGVNIDIQNAYADGGEASGDTLISIENIIGSDTASVSDTIYGDTQVNMFYGLSGNDILEGAGGADVLDGGAGHDYARYTRSNSAVSVNLTTGINTGADANGDILISIENIVGSAYGDTLTGNALSNVIDGGNGDDVLNGAGGVDTLTYVTSSSAVNVDISLSSSQNTGGSGYDTLSNFENLIGSSYSDTLSGDGADNVIEGGNGNDIINGGAGNDTISFESASSRTNFNLSLTIAQFTKSSGTDTVTGFENILGSSYSDDLVGDANDNIIDGGSGTGADNMNGGAGIDTVSYASASAGVLVNLSTTALQNTVGAGKDNIAEFENILGSYYADTLTGDTNSNVIDGNAGNDNLIGGAGQDTLIGGLGIDVLTGGLDGDIFDFNLDGLDTSFDRITDFSTTQGDKIDLKDLLVGFDAVTSAITDFVEFTTSGANTVIKVDRDGTGTTYGWQQMAQLDNATGLTDEATLRINGNLIVA